MDFVLHHALVTAPGGSPDRWMLMLHGILGSGANLRGIARRITAADPRWGAVLVDLRMHGASTSAPPPHTIDAAAEDLARLEAVLPGPVRGVFGHSFGGKVALAFIARRRAELDVAFIVDANPGSRPPERVGANDVVATLAALPSVWPSRARFLEATGERGIDRPTAEWLAMNLLPDGDAFRFRLDLKAISELMIDYCARDDWPVIESAIERPAFHVVVAGLSDSFSPADRGRLAEDARLFHNVSMHVAPSSGHNVHVDAPDALVAVIATALGAVP